MIAVDDACGARPAVDRFPEACNSGGGLNVVAVGGRAAIHFLLVEAAHEGLGVGSTIGIGNPIIACIISKVACIATPCHTARMPIVVVAGIHIPCAG